MNWLATLALASIGIWFSAGQQNCSVCTLLQVTLSLRLIPCFKICFIIVSFLSTFILPRLFMCLAESFVRPRLQSRRQGPPAACDHLGAALLQRRCVKHLHSEIFTRLHILKGLEDASMRPRSGQPGSEHNRCLLDTRSYASANQPQACVCWRLPDGVPMTQGVIRGFCFRRSQTKLYSVLVLLRRCA